ncbi:MAG: hypothetical protein IPM47_05635 [Sphingobacteriales bacterium]|nr:MAG: hypothetical protein IPM47_05635 [Sphingobacteriales bacterium]
MKNQANWQKIKKALKENFILIDFQDFATTAFVGVDFDKGLEIFRYILEQKLPNHDETKSVFEKLELYADGQLNKDIFDGLIAKYEPFLKKMFEIIEMTYAPNPQRPKPIALGWCYNELFSKLSIPKTPQKDEFYATIVNGKIETPTHQSSHFTTNFLTDSTKFGKALHSSYHFRNSQIHDDPSFTNRKSQELITDTVNSYLYFTFKYYNELSTKIPPNDLQPSSTLTIRDLASLSGGAYNPDVENEVKRDNIIQTIENKIKNLDVLFIEGEEGIGKTTILHQFVAKYPNDCFAYFIDSKDSSTYSNSSILKAFCNQFHFVKKGCVLEEDNVNINLYTDEDWLKNYLHSERIRNKPNQTFYFIIDGLDEISQDRQNEIKELILDKLPYDKTNIKLLLSGQQNKNLVKRDCQYDKYEIPFLSKDESLVVFGSSITSEKFESINKACKNNAGKIVFFRYLIKNRGISVDNITDKLSPSNLKSIFQYLWNDIDENCKIILAIIAFQDEKFNSKDISKIIGLSEREIINSLQFLSFVKKNARGKYEFIFDDFMDFAKNKLTSYKRKIDEIVIKYLLSDLDSIDSLVRLPEMYKKTGKKDDLMKLLTDERWKQILKASEKISDISRVSNVALEAIQDEKENKYIPTILKYSVLKSALKELSRTTVWQYEIAASLVLKDYMEAQNLANIAFLKEDKLKMFAFIARAYTERKEKIPNDIQRNIQELYDDIDLSKNFKNIKESAVEIASLLMYSNPKLAFRLIEDLSGSILDNDNAFDWALAQISLSIHSNLENLEDVSKEDIDTKVYSKIRNPKIKEFADAILYLSENQTSDQIIEKINQLESTSQKMFLIRNWIGNNQKDENVDKIIELGLKLVVDKSDRYVPKSSDYKIFAMPLPYLKEKDKAYELVEKIEQYTASIEANSGTNDLLAIKLFIARTLCKFEFEKGEEKLLDIYTEIGKVADLAIRCTCFAIYANEATRIKQIHQEENLDVYLEAAKRGIDDNIDKILEQTASHFEIVQSIITNLVRLYPDNAIEICRKLNKSIDRDNAFLEALATYLNQRIEKIDTKIVDKLLDNIVDVDIQKIAISEIVNRLEVLRDSEKVNIYQFLKYLEKVDNLFDNRIKCLLYVKIISIYEQNEQDFSIICNKLNQTWNELEKSVYKIELGFEIAYHAAFLKNKEFAQKTRSAVKEEKDRTDLLLDSPNTTEIFSLVVELAIRVFSGLILKNNYEQKDIENIEKLIGSLPSERQQMSLWSSLILRIIHKAKDDKLPKQLINSYIIPKLSKIKNKNERISAILEVIVVLYFDDKNMRNINELPNQKLKDIALSRICKFLFTKCLPHDPCDDQFENYAIDHDIVGKILELVKLMENDYFIAHQIINIRKSVLSKYTKISSQKKVEIKNEFEKIANTKLPDPNNIKHYGYQLLVKSNALAIKSKPTWEEWDSILQEVEKIPNLSDRIYMWDSIAELLPNEFMKQKKHLISKAIESAYNLPSFVDTVERIGMILFTLHKKSIDSFGLKQLLDNLIRAINNNPHSPSLRENYKKILDVAHSTDPQIAKALVNSFDNDTARFNTGAYLGNHLNLLEFQSKINKKLNPDESEQSLLENNPKFFNQIIEKKLARLNASKSVVDNLLPKNLVYQLKIASEYSIFESHNAFSYFIERLVLMYEDTDESKKLIYNSFLELIDVCNLIKLLSIRNADKIRSLLDVLSPSDEENKTIQNHNTEIDNDTRNTILNLLSKGKTVQEIAAFLEIEIEVVKLLNV